MGPDSPSCMYYTPISMRCGLDSALFRQTLRSDNDTVPVCLAIVGATPGWHGCPTPLRSTPPRGRSPSGACESCHRRDRSRIARGGAVPWPSAARPCPLMHRSHAKCHVRIRAPGAFPGHGLRPRLRRLARWRISSIEPGTACGRGDAKSALVRTAPPSGVWVCTYEPCQGRSLPAPNTLRDQEETPGM